MKTNNTQKGALINTNIIKNMLRYKTETRPGLVALYDIRPGNGAGPFLQPRSPHGASRNVRVHSRCQWSACVTEYSLRVHATNVRLDYLRQCEIGLKLYTHDQWTKHGTRKRARCTTWFLTLWTVLPATQQSVLKWREITKTLTTLSCQNCSNHKWTLTTVYRSQRDVLSSLRKIKIYWYGPRG